MSLSSRDALLPALTRPPILGPSVVLHPSFTLVEPLFVRQLMRGLLNGICSHSSSKHLKKATQVLIGAQLLCELLYAPQSLSVAGLSKL